MKKTIRIALMMFAALAVMSAVPVKADPPVPTCDPCPK